MRRAYAACKIHIPETISILDEIFAINMSCLLVCSIEISPSLPVVLGWIMPIGK
jgi:hypothetical protein